MEQELKRLIRREFPELASGYHLPHFARIEAISDTAAAGDLCDPFRPRFAVDLAVLTAKGTVDQELPIFRAVPLPLACAGLERGMLGFPEPGSIVEVAFGYGLPDKIFIRQVLPWHSGLPAIGPGETLAQAAPGVFERTSANGDKQRVTHGDINDACMHYHLDAHSQASTVNEHFLSANTSDERVTGKKEIQAQGAVKINSGGALNVGALDNINVTSASDVNTVAARNLNEVCGQIAKRLAVLKQLVQVQDGGTVWIGSESVNALEILSELIGVVADIATTTATHNHPSVGACSQGAAFSALATTANGLKTELDPIVE